MGNGGRRELGLNTQLVFKKYPQTNWKKTIKYILFLLFVFIICFYYLFYFDVKEFAVAGSGGADSCQVITRLKLPFW